jgi:hypothetical protein
MPRGKARQTIDLIRACLAILEEIQPASVRAVCYQLFVRKLIDSMEKKNTNRVSTQLVWAREQRYLDWDWIVDETREPEYAATWDTPDKLIQDVVKNYRKDRWTLQPQQCQVWSEKGTVRGTLRPVLEEYGVTFQVMHGYSSATVLHQVALESRQLKRPLLVFYCGDWDPSGMHMSEVDIPSRLKEYGANVELQRVALTQGDVLYQGLPSFPLDDKAKDPRCKWFGERYGDRCWELDALSPVLLRQAVADAITSAIDDAAWAEADKIEAVEVDSLNKILTEWNKLTA